MVILLAALVFPAAAQNVSFSHLEQVQQDLLIYSYNATSGDQELIGQYNTSSPFVPLPESDFNIVVRPSTAARFLNPGAALEDALSFVETYWIQLLIIVFILAVVWGRK